MEEINLYKLLGFYVRNWLLILSLTLLGLLGGLVYNQFIQTPMYKSTATLLLIKDTTVSYQDNALLNNYVQLFQSRRVLEPVIEKEGLNVSFNDFKNNVEATNDKNTEVIRLSVKTDSPNLSETFLSSAVDSFKQEAKELYSKDKLVVVDGASDAEPPYNVNKDLQLLLGAAIGFGISLLGLFFIFDAKKGRVEDWGKGLRAKKENRRLDRNAKRLAFRKSVVKTRQATKAETTPKLKSLKSESNLLRKIKTAALNGVWIEPANFDGPSRDELEK